MGINNLGEYLKKLTYEHIIFYKRVEELENLLETNPLNAIEVSTHFLENVVFPHMVKEEKTVIPVIPNKAGEREKILIEELSKEHEEMEKLYESFRKSLSNGKITDAAAQLKKILTLLKLHSKKEESLFEFILKRYLEEK
ncbi:MAG: hemerythrin domain-containing protein [Candidatus Bathyarchaeia archaeon]